MAHLAAPVDGGLRLELTGFDDAESGMLYEGAKLYAKAELSPQCSFAERVRPAQPPRPPNYL